MSARRTRPPVLVAVIAALSVCLSGCSAPTAAEVRPGMEAAVSAVIAAAGEQADPTVTLRAHCGPDDSVEDGATLLVSSQVPTADTAGIVMRATRTLRGQDLDVDATGSGKVLLTARPDGDAWTMTVTTATDGKITARATAEVSSDEPPEDLTVTPCG